MASVDDDFIRGLGLLMKLERLFLCGTVVTGSGFKDLALRRLTFLSIGGAMQSAHFRHLCRAAPGLQDLRLERCGKV